MSSGYEALLSMAKSYLTDDVKQITEDMIYLTMTYKKRYQNYFIFMLLL